MRKGKHAPKSEMPEAAAPVAVQMSVALDFPREGETLTGQSYSLRVSAAEEAEVVEVSIDKGAWQLCRRESGYWWFDWDGIAPGPHQARARMRGPGGLTKMTLLRRFQAKAGL